MIFSVLIQNITPKNVIASRISITGLQNALCSDQSFRMPAERLQIMTSLFTASGIDDIEVKVIAMKTLVEVVKQDYDFIEDYFYDLT
jgi:hypothetical protein